MIDLVCKAGGADFPRYSTLFQQWNRRRKGRSPRRNFVYGEALQLNSSDSSTT